LPLVVTGRQIPTGAANATQDDKFHLPKAKPSSSIHKNNKRDENAGFQPLIKDILFICNCDI
jgi:hypothetical protein